MDPKDFVTTYLPYAKETEQKTGISAIAILAQAAVESGWGTAAPGNMFFGVKVAPGATPANEQLLTTTEYSRRADLKFPVVLSVTPVVMNGVKMFKYKVKDYFRKYATPEESFTDHASFFLNNSRYAGALAVKQDPVAFINAIAKAGYATDPNYATTLDSVVKMIEAHIPVNNTTTQATPPAAGNTV
ncbi:glucosaminidase domain-containing protein [Panacibacter sp. DH6]|uniref:Glucosaminidase domain-containing protein n=1 Tax=Panacibacter microcysteis TaxID=2793269 RepID=A0A931GXY7_9BACT|nr:glucosaminidase domain-containing protein [Panacibacter microcysteis]MBG9376919.1 glucosaminidase domain-containing protein [Panacibacter microcysteis]